MVSTPIDAKNMGQAKNTVNFLEEQYDQKEKNLEPLRKRRAHVAAEFQAWQTTELAFYDRLIGRVRECQRKLKERKDLIARKVAVAMKVVDKVKAKVSEETRIRKNQEASKRKEPREDLKRKKMQAGKVLSKLA